MTVLLATSGDLPQGEPGAPVLDVVLAERGIEFARARWDDPDVDWAAADLARAVATFGTSVVKPRVGAGGAGLMVVNDPDDPRLVDGAWVVQPWSSRSAPMARSRSTSSTGG